MRKIHRAATLGVTVLFSGLALAACTSAPTAEVGDCLDSDVLQGEISSLPTVDCGEPHDSEVYHKFELPDEEYPGAGAVDEAAKNGCLAEFEQYVGIEYTDSDLWITYLNPIEENWKADREIICVLQADEDVTDTLKGSNR